MRVLCGTFLSISRPRRDWTNFENHFAFMPPLGNCDAIPYRDWLDFWHSPPSSVPCNELYFAIRNIKCPATAAPQTILLPSSKMQATQKPTQPLRLDNLFFCC